MPTRIKPISLSLPEARATLDVLTTITSYTRFELRDQFGWGQREIDAWSNALKKIDAAIVATGSTR